MPLVRCDCCHGRKKLLQLGNIVKDCQNCNGLGYVEDKPVVNEVLAEIVLDKRTKEFKSASRKTD